MCFPFTSGSVFGMIMANFNIQETEDKARLSFARSLTMKIDCITVGPFGVNCYILHKKGKAVVIDPGAEPEKILKTIISYKLDVTAYILTHGHIDHISALPGLTSEKPAPILISAQDAKWAFTRTNCLAPIYPPLSYQPETMREIAHNDIISEAPIPLSVLFTPGHSPGGICLYASAQNILFSGDTIFQNSVGRTDLPGGDEKKLMHSIALLSALPANTVVYPGHGPATTIGDEVNGNPFLV